MLLHRILEKDRTTFGLLYAVLFYVQKKLIPQLKPMTIKSHDNNFTAMPRLFSFKMIEYR